MRQFKDSIDCYKKARNIWRKMGNGRDDCDEIASLYVGLLFFFSIFYLFLTFSE